MRGLDRKKICQDAAVEASLSLFLSLSVIDSTLLVIVSKRIFVSVVVLLAY